MTASSAVVDGAVNRLQYEQFLAALDVDQVRRSLQGQVDLGHGSDLAVLDAKFEPGRPAVLLYRAGDRLVHGTIPVPDGSPGQQAVLRLTDYPNDPALPGLPCARSAQCLSASIERGHLDGPVTVGQVRSRLLRYRPGRRATFEVVAELSDATGARVTRLVAKVYHDRAKADPVVREARELAQQPVPPPLVLARVVAHDPDRALVVQEHLPGAQLVVDVGREPASETTEQVRLAARALAAFHGLAVTAARPRSLERELQRFASRSAGVRSVDDETGAALLDLTERLDRLPRPDLDRSLVHGDCKPAQFRLDGARVALLDLDHCGLADPAYDVGNLLASLRQQAIQHGHPRSGRAVAVELGAAFLDAYTAARSAPGGQATWARPLPDRLEERVEAFVAISLMRKALRAFARDPRSSTARQLVAEAHRGLDDQGGAPS